MTKHHQSESCVKKRQFFIGMYFKLISSDIAHSSFDILTYSLFGERILSTLQGKQLSKPKLKIINQGVVVLISKCQSYPNNCILPLTQSIAFQDICPSKVTALRDKGPPCPFNKRQCYFGIFL